MNLYILRFLPYCLLLLFVGCKETAPNLQSKENDYKNQSFYLKNNTLKPTNSYEKIPLLLEPDASSTDSIWVFPKTVYNLTLQLDWEDKTFPSEVFNFPNLKYLWIGMRGFEELPKEITQLKNLEHLDLQHGLVKKLPDNIGELKKLEILTLLFSAIEELPLSICELSSLKKLHLGGTAIKTLPPCLKKLKNLRSVILFYEEEKASNKLLKEVEELKKHLKHCYFDVH